MQFPAQLFRQCRALGRKAAAHQAHKPQYRLDDLFGRGVQGRVPVKHLCAHEPAIQREGKLDVRAAHIDAAQGKARRLSARLAQLILQRHGRAFRLFPLERRIFRLITLFKAKLPAAAACRNACGDAHDLAIAAPPCLTKLEHVRKAFVKGAELPVGCVKEQPQRPTAVHGEDIVHAGIEIFRRKALFLFRLPAGNGAGKVPHRSVVQRQTQLEGSRAFIREKGRAQLRQPERLVGAGPVKICREHILLLSSVFIYYTAFFCLVKHRPPHTFQTGQAMI